MQRNTRWIYDEVTLFPMVTPKNTYRDLLKTVAKPVAKYAHQYQTFYVEIVNNQYIKGSTWFKCRDGDFT